MLVQHSNHSLTKHMNYIYSYLYNIYIISRSFFKITYLWHTRVATAISDQHNEQHIKKIGITHCCYEILILGQFFHGRVSFDLPRVKTDQGSTFFISLPKITQST